MADRRPSVTFTIPTREGAPMRARRLLLEGRVRVRLVHRGRVHVEVRGDSGRVHAVNYSVGEWHCSCEAQRPGCAHMLACWLVVASEAP